MDDFRMRFYAPIVTGTPSLEQTVASRKQKTSSEQSSFQEILQQNLSKNSQVSFSKHAVKRAVDHQIELSEDQLTRLNEGVRLAEQKNLGDTLILVGQTAFLVNVKNNVVITAVEGSEMKGNVFTNIDGTVVI